MVQSGDRSSDNCKHDWHCMGVTGVLFKEVNS